MSYDSREDTMKHKNRVKELMYEFTEKLKEYIKDDGMGIRETIVNEIKRRGDIHDDSKLESIEIR